MGFTILGILEDGALVKKRLSKETLLVHLTKMRISAGLTQQSLADKLGKPQSFVSKYEIGERNLDFLEVIAIFEALEADPLTEIKRLLS